MARDDTAIVQLQVRMREDLRRSLEEAAKAREVPLNTVIVERLNYTRDRVNLLPEVLTLAYGREAAGFLMMLGLIMKTAGDTYHVRTRPDDDGSPWTDNPIAIGNIAHAVLALLEAAKPNDQAVKPDMGVKCALQLIEAAANPAGKGWFTSDHQSTEAIRLLLGPLVDRMATAVASRPIVVLDPAVQEAQVGIAAVADVIGDVFAILSQRNRDIPVPTRQEIFEAAEKRLSPAWQEMVRRSGRPFAVRVAPNITSLGTIKIGTPVLVETSGAGTTNEQVGSRAGTGARKARRVRKKALDE